MSITPTFGFSPLHAITSSLAADNQCIFVLVPLSLSYKPVPNRSQSSHIADKSLSPAQSPVHGLHESCPSTPLTTTGPRTSSSNSGTNSMFSWSR